MGGWSTMLRLFLERLLVGPCGFATVGVPLLIDGEHRLVFARLTNLLSDGDGHRQALGWKGASGLKPCFKHFNVFKKDRKSPPTVASHASVGSMFECPLV